MKHDSNGDKSWSDWGVNTGSKDWGANTEEGSA